MTNSQDDIVAGSRTGNHNYATTSETNDGNGEEPEENALETARTDVDAMHRGNLLLLAQFLTSFRSFYDWEEKVEEEDDGEDEGGDDEEEDEESVATESETLEAVITPEDIREGLIYRYLLRCKQRVIDQQYSLQTELLVDGGKELCKEQTMKKDLLQEIQEQLKEQLSKRPERDVLIHQMLERFEVWTTKDLAHTFLMPPCDCHSFDDATHSCWSKLLHVPGAAHFADRWPQISTTYGVTPAIGPNSTTGETEPSLVQEGAESRSLNTQQQERSESMHVSTNFSKLYHQAHVRTAKHPMCSLIVPPNYHTWEEYARIALMVSYLPTEEARKAAADSPFCAALKTMQRCRPKNPINPTIIALTTNNHSPTAATKKNVFAADCVIEPHDLVALWVSANRDLEALRHLIQLFAVPNDVLVQGPKIHSSMFRFQGNRNGTRQKVIEETKIVEELVEWAVMNQVLYYYHFIQHQVELHYKESSNNRHRQQGSQNQSHHSGSSASPRPAKKRRKETGAASVSDNSDETDGLLLQACYRYLLRWFCRRNHDKLSILYYSDSDQSSLPPSSASPRDQSFQQIDRRIRRGKYSLTDFSQDGKNTPFYRVVIQLLQDWSDHVARNASPVEISPAESISVREDFDLLHGNFFRVLARDGIQVAAEYLLDLPQMGSFMDFFRVSDDDSVFQNDIPTSRALPDLLFWAPPPWKCACSDCAKGSKSQQDNSGLTVCSMCENAFHDYRYEPSRFSRFQMEEALPEVLACMSLTMEIPESDLVPDFRGVKAAKLQWTRMTLAIMRETTEDGKLEPFGITLRQTEVSRDSLTYITNGALKFDSLYDETFEEEYPLALDIELQGCLVTHLHRGGAGERAGFRTNDVIVEIQLSTTDEVHRLATYTKEDRLNLIRSASNETRITVMRPNMDLLAQTKKWLESIREHNKFLLDVSAESISICEECRSRGDALVDSEAESDRIIREAMNCRAVIRRIGLEYYSKFLHDDEEIGAPADSLEEEEKRWGYVCFRRLDAMMNYIILSRSGLKGKAPTVLRNSFFLPPSISSDRLPWVSKDLENNPTDLLLKGVGILIRQRGWRHKHEKKAFIKHFIMLVCTWCRRKPNGAPASVPPDAALVARQPWPLSTCCGCFGRAGERSYYGFRVCESALCLSKVDAAVSSTYDDCAGLVGTTVLFFPDDTRLEDVRKGTNLDVDSHGRPIEFIVAFYSPKILEGTEGEFFLLPVATKTQLKYLVDRCTVVKQPVSLSSIEDWLKKSILALRGVLRLSRNELDAYVDQTAAFFDHVGREIASYAQRDAPESIGFPEKPVAATPAAFLPRHSFSSLNSHEHMARFVNSSLKQCCSLLTCAVQSPTPVMRLMIESSDTRQETGKDTTAGSDSHLEDVTGDELLWELSSWPAKTVRSQLEEVQDSPEDTQDGPEGIQDLSRANFSLPQSDDDARFGVLFTDLYTTQKQEVFRLEKVLSKQTLRFPEGGDEDDYIEKNIVLVRSQTDTQVADGESFVHEYDGVGWGFELLWWKSCKHKTRIGRVHPRSPAARSGLRLDDILLSINGRDLGPGNRWTLPFLCCSILASPLCVGIAKSVSGVPYDEIIRSIKEIGANGPVHGPLVLRILRRRELSAAPSRDSAGVGPRHPSNLLSPLLPSRKTGEVPVDSQKRSNQIGDASYQAQQAIVSQHSGPSWQNGKEGGALSHSITSQHHRHEKSLSSGNQGHQPPPAEQMVTELTAEERQRRLLGNHRLLEALTRLAETIRWSLNRRSPLHPENLYVALGLNTVLTEVEAAVFLESVHQGIPMMGLRLLTPRYSLDVLVQQVLRLDAQRACLHQVPRISDGLWQYILTLDYSRYEKESKLAPLIFCDQSGKFPLPTERLPLDRLAEKRARILAIDNGGTAPAQVQVEPAMHQGFQQPAPARVEPAQVEQAMQVQGFQQQHTTRGPSVTQPYGTHEPHPYRPHPHQQPHEAQAPQPYYVKNSQLYPANYQANNGSNTSQMRPAQDYAGYSGPYENNEKRIRGGGGPSTFPEESASSIENRSLLSLPISSWHDQPVYTEVETSRENKETGRAELYGYVQIPDHWNVSDGSALPEVLVAIVFISTVGVPSEVHEHFFHPCDLRLIEEGDVRLNLLKNTEKENLMGKYKAAIQLEKQSAALVRMLCRQSEGSLKPLGHLPDGRIILWLPSDPIALYISCDSSASLAEEKSLHECIASQNHFRKPYERIMSRGWHCCMWGCTFENKDANGSRRLVEFGTLPFLQQHNSHFHAYNSGTSSAFSFGDWRFLRVEDSFNVRSLSSGLSSAACVRSAKLAMAAKRTPATAIDHFDERVFCSPCGENLALEKREVNEILTKNERSRVGSEKIEPVSHILDILSNINLLFDFSGESLKLTRGAKSGLEEAYVPSPGNLPRLWTPCSECSENATPIDDHKFDGTNCSLCCLGSEEVMQRHRESDDMDFDQRDTVRGGLGCGFPGNILFPQLSDNIIGGELGHAKKELLRFARTIPSQLRITESRQKRKVQPGALAFLRQVMWQHEGSEAFSRFVMRSSSVHMLTQAFVVLLASIDLERLPDWWQAAAGWSGSVFRLLLAPSKSSLMLQLFLFDVGLAEYIEAAAEEPPFQTLILNTFPASYRELTTQERINHILKTANLNSVQPFRGAHDYYCAICDDGGELVCCEFCSRVVHSDCCNPPVGNLPNWVCASCTVDILDLDLEN